MDTELVKRAQHGDRQAFGLLAVDIATRFLAISRRILRDLDLAEDATQQALVAIWRDLPQLRDPARFDAWSYRLLVRACYAEGRAVRRWSPNLHVLPEDAPAASNALDEVIDRDQLERAIRRLSVDHRAVLVLHYYADLPPDRVAQILEIRALEVIATIVGGVVVYCSHTEVCGGSEATPDRAFTTSGWTGRSHLRARRRCSLAAPTTRAQNAGGCERLLNDRVVAGVPGI